MSDDIIAALIIVSALGAGLVGGIFFAFSTFVMAALARLRPDQGIATMQSINVTVHNPWFLGAFFGTAVGCAALAVLAALDLSRPGAVLLLVGGLLYLVGTIGVTMAANVPRTNALARVEPESTDGVDLWTRYLSVWTMWNHIRTGASLCASAAFILALR